MRSYVLFAILLQVALGGELSRFSVQMPYLNPAGITYRLAPPPGVAIAGPAFRTSPLAAGTTSVAYGPLAAAALTSVRSALPLQYTAETDVSLHPSPILPLRSSSHYHALDHVPLAEVDTIHHVPGVADIPITRYEAQHGYVQKLVDVAKAKVATRKIEVRRPAIEKTFYDIEERIVIRPAGSAVVELTQPLSETQKGPTLVSPALSLHPIHVPDMAIQSYPVPASPVLENPATPQYPEQLANVGNLPIEDSEFDDSDSITVDNPEISGRSQSSDPSASTPQPQTETRTIQQEQTQQSNEEQNVPGEFLNDNKQQSNVQQSNEQQSNEQQSNLQQSNLQQSNLQQPNLQQLEQQGNQQFRQSQKLFQDQLSQILNQYQRRNQLFKQIQEQMFQLDQILNTDYELNQKDTSSTRPETSPIANDIEEAQSRMQSNSNLTEPNVLSQTLFRSVLDDKAAVSKTSSRSSDLIQSVQNLTPDKLQENQQRLIDLLTARGGVAEVGFGRSGVSVSSAGDAGQVKARVLSVTPAPHTVEPAGERVHTRRIVVSRPIQTVQEIDVVEPFTKLERVAVHEPAILKTAKLGVARLHTAVPVAGKSLTPALPLAYVHH